MKDSISNKGRVKTMSEISNDFWKLDFHFICYLILGVKLSS